MIKRKLLLAIIPLLMVSCGAEPTPVDPTPIEPSQHENPVTPVKEQQDEYIDFFDHTNKVQIELDFSNTAIQNFAKYGVSDFAHSEQYHPCKTTIKINNIVRFEGEEVGSRMKGNTSLNSKFISNDSRFVDNQYCHFKLSFCETFDNAEDNDYYSHNWSDESLKKERKDRRFGEMKKIDLKYNKNKDNTFTREAYALSMYQNEGLLAGNCNLVELTVKTECDSRTTVYMAYETIDKQMFKHHLAKKERDGDLYKIKWGANLTRDSFAGGVGEETASFSPTYEIKTNEDTTDNHYLYNAMRVLETRGTADDIKGSIDETFNVEYLLKMFALQWVAGDPDDWRNNCNNTYIYFNSIDNKMIIIPYDQDRVFGILQDWPIDTSSSKCTETKMLGYNNEWQKNPLYWRLILKEESIKVKYSDNYPVIEEYREKYINYCKEYSSKYLVTSKFEDFNNEFFYAPSKNGTIGGGANLSFNGYVTRKTENII